MTAAFRRANRRTFASLRRHRNYRLFFAGQIVSVSGTWMQNIAAAWLVLQLTDSGRKLLRSTRKLRTAWLAERMRRLSDAELRALEAALEPLARLTRDERPA